MSEYGDEWDELVEEDEQKDPNVFELGDCLAAPKARSYTTRQLHSEYKIHLCGSCISMLTYRCCEGFIHEGVIDLNPPYQRGKYPIVIVSRLSHCP